MATTSLGLGICTCPRPKEVVDWYTNGGIPESVESGGGFSKPEHSEPDFSAPFSQPIFFFQIRRCQSSRFHPLYQLTPSNFQNSPLLRNRKPIFDGMSAIRSKNPLGLFLWRNLYVYHVGFQSPLLRFKESPTISAVENWTIQACILDNDDLFAHHDPFRLQVPSY